VGESWSGEVRVSGRSREERRELRDVRTWKRRI
jgi:hypothetical protein